MRSLFPLLIFRSAFAYHTRMLILVDEDIPDGPEAFAALGEVRTFSGRSVGAADLAAADAIVVRSVSRVDERLLAGSGIRFVGTVTTGTDHVDVSWLERRGIAFASAAGCNAPTVAEYVLAAVLLLAGRLGFDPAARTLGIIGVGRIGSRVARWAKALGMSVLLCDPPLRRRTGDSCFIDAAELTRRADLVTLHVPLTEAGPDATRDLVDERWLAGLKEGAVLINTSRGEVVKEDCLPGALDAGRLSAVVLDVWRNEPNIDPALLRRIALATPHIAGYSVEARRRGVGMIAEALAAFAGEQGGAKDSETRHGRTERAGAILQRRTPKADSPQDEDLPGGNTGLPRETAAAGGRGIGPTIGAPRTRGCKPMPPTLGSSEQQRPIPVDVGGMLRAAGLTPAAPVWQQAGAVVGRCCDLGGIDAAFREAVFQAPAATAFDGLRRACASRNEFRAYHLLGDASTAGVCSLLSTFGFRA